MAKAKKTAETKTAAAKTGPAKSRGPRKLNDTQVQNIVATYKGRGKGPSMKAVAEQFSVSIGTVSSIIRGKTYAWLTGIGVEQPLAQAA